MKDKEFCKMAKNLARTILQLFGSKYDESDTDFKKRNEKIKKIFDEDYYKDAEIREQLFQKEARELIKNKVFINLINTLDSTCQNQERIEKNLNLFKDVAEYLRFWTYHHAYWIEERRGEIDERKKYTKRS